MKKKLFALALSAAAALGTVWAAAEQPKAEEYRRILQSDTFYVESQNEADDMYGRAFDGDKREAYVWFLNEEGTAFDHCDGPRYMYRDGYYYNFWTENSATVARAEDVESKRSKLDPKEYWGMTRENLMLPEEFAIFAPEKCLSDSHDSFGTPQFVSSGKAFEKRGEIRASDYRLFEPFMLNGATGSDGEVYDYDKYAAPGIGKESGTKMFYAYYLNGELKKIKMTIRSITGREILFGVMMVGKITEQLPENAFAIPAKIEQAKYK